MHIFQFALFVLSSHMERLHCSSRPKEFVPFIPNMYHKKPGLVWNRLNCLMPSAVCVAKRPIVDEELFLNYRYNPSNKYPDWYHQPDEEEAKRRWGKMSAFQL